MNKKLFHGIVVLSLLSTLITAPLALAAKPSQPAPNKPGVGPVPTNAVHTSNLAGTIAYDLNNAPTGVVGGTVSLEVDQAGVIDPIVFANISLPSGFTWNGDESITVTCNEDGGGPMIGWTSSISGRELGISGLSLSDADEDDIVEFTISVTTVTGITTTEEATGLYGVSSQYRTNPTRKTKEQTWVLSTPSMINLTVTEAITWNYGGADGATNDGPSTYTTGSSIGSLPTAPTYAGYTFAGWWVDSTFTTGSAIDSTYTPGTPYGAVTFYAKWVINGTFSCSISGTFTIVSSVVTDSTDCVGAVVVPSGVTGIGARAFDSVPGLTSITIPASITSIGNYAFEAAINLTTVTFENGSQLGQIGQSAFREADALTSITIPASVTSIGAKAFEYTDTLATVTFENGSQLGQIGQSAFRDADALTSITIPASVTSIGATAFEYSGQLLSIYFLGNAPVTVGNRAFADIASGATAYITNGATGFAAEGSLWNALIVDVQS